MPVAKKTKSVSKVSVDAKQKTKSVSKPKVVKKVKNQVDTNPARGTLHVSSVIILIFFLISFVSYIGTVKFNYDLATTGRGELFGYTVRADKMLGLVPLIFGPLYTLQLLSAFVYSRILIRRNSNKVMNLVYIYLTMIIMAVISLFLELLYIDSLKIENAVVQNSASNLFGRFVGIVTLIIITSSVYNSGKKK